MELNDAVASRGVGEKMGAVAGRVEQGRVGGAVRVEPCGWSRAGGESEVTWTPLPWGVYGERVDAVASEGFRF